MRRFVTLFLSVAMVMVFFNCEELITNEEDSSGDPNSELADYSAEELADTASAALGETMTELMSGVSGDPTTMDLAGVESANQIFKMAIEKDPANSAANFGAALTELLLIMDSESAFMTQVIRWEAFLDTTDIFGESLEDDGLGKRIAGGQSLMTKNPLALEPTPSLSGATYLKAVMSLPKYAQTYPQFSDWQDLIESEILQKVDFATAALALVEQNADFVFPITPEMQGNPEADTLELDLTEVYLFDAILQGVSAVCNIAIAYDLNMNSYDSTAMKQLLSKDGSFMTVRSGKEAAMPTALDNIVAVLEKTEAALDFLENESDDQLDDLITLDLATTGEIDTVHMVLDSLQLAFAGPFDMELSTLFPPSSGDVVAKASTTPEVITVDLTALFDGTNGPFEPKSVLPAYTVEVGIDTIWDYDPASEVHVNEYLTASLTVQDTGFYVYNFWERYDSYWGYEMGGDSNVEISGFDTRVTEAMDSLFYLYGDTLSFAKVGIYWSNTFGEDLTYPHTTDVNAELYIDYALQYPEWVDHYPVIIWNADDFYTWIDGFDPTFNGIFPNFTKTTLEDLFMDFGMNHDSWTKNADDFQPIYPTY